MTIQVKGVYSSNSRLFFRIPRSVTKKYAAGTVIDYKVTVGDTEILIGKVLVSPRRRPKNLSKKDPNSIATKRMEKRKSSHITKLIKKREARQNAD